MAAELVGSPQLPPLSLYVHIPWCVRKCPYCDFNSHVAGHIAAAGSANTQLIASTAIASKVIAAGGKSGESEPNLPEAEYVRQLQLDLASQLPWVQGRKLGSIFFGGGTPSLFSAQAIGEILQAAELSIGFASDIEITLEANPGTFEQNKFAGYRSAGVNRLSIGVQSFDQRQLENLGRIHNGKEAAIAASRARSAGFDNINLDLMHGLPQQTEEQALEDLRMAVSLGAEHISWYQLTIEPNTAFYSAPPVTPGSARIAAMQAAGREYLAAQGYQRYEVSAYGQPGRNSRHNLNYWSFADYLGIGAGAHGKLTLPVAPGQQGGGQIVRTQRTRAPKDYLALAANKGVAEGRADGRTMVAPKLQPIAPADLPLEFLMNTLRLSDGVPVESFTAYTGLPLSALTRNWAGLQAMDLVQPLGPRVCASPFGYDYLDEILQRFLRSG